MDARFEMQWSSGRGRHEVVVRRLRARVARRPGRWRKRMSKARGPRRGHQEPGE